MDDYMVVYKNLPYKVHGFTMYNAAENYYTIVLNSRISYNCAQKAFEHELCHIYNGDLSSNTKNVNKIEFKTHALF